MIYYKVVHRRLRYGSNACGWMRNRGKRTFRPPFGLGQFFPIYEKGATIRGAKGTGGLFVFRTEENAKSFQKWCNSKRTTIIVRVESKSKPKIRVPFLGRAFGLEGLRLFEGVTKKELIEWTKNLDRIYKGACCVGKLTVLD